MFKSALGYDLSNYQGLIDQIRAGIVGAQVKPALRDEHGQRYTAFIAVTGPNGKTVDVTTGWIIRPGRQLPDLTSAYINSKGKKNA